MVQIANPIYDVVFKYLMEDSKIAKLLLSTIIGEEIEQLQFLPQESTYEYEKRTLTVYRLDFSATIKTSQGQKQVIIELQKAKLPTDIMRFRRYLGEQYRKRENTYYKTIAGKSQKIPLPIISIYFLGYTLGYTLGPVVKVNRICSDCTTGQQYEKIEEFVESLTHETYIIQIPLVHGKRRTELEKLLSVFDQENRSSDYHILNVSEDDFPKRYQIIIRRLQRAIAKESLRRSMDIEDDIIEEVKDMERDIELKEQVITQQSKTLKEKDKKLEEKDKKLIEQNKKLEKQNERLDEQAKRLDELETLLRDLRKG